MSGSVGNHSTNILPAQDPTFVPPRGEGHVADAPGSETGAPAAAVGGEQPGPPFAGRAAVPTSSQVSADVVAAAVAYLATPALVVLAGPPGAGRSTALRR